MSLFGGMMGGFEEDPVFGNASRMMHQMDSMMSSMMRDPFGGDPFGSMMGAPMMGGMGMIAAPPMRQQQNQMALMGPNTNMNALNIMGNPMTMMNSMMSNMDRMTGESTSQVFSSSSVMSMTTGPDGRPQVYQSSSSSRGMPGGVRETQHSVSDSSTGLRKMAIGHHIGDRAHIIEKERNRDGEEERQEFLNLDEEEADDFESEFRRAVGPRQQAALGGGRGRTAAPLAIEGGRYNSSPANTAPAPARHAALPAPPMPSVDAGNDRYGYERISMPRTNGIDVTKFDRTAADRSAGIERLEYHRPNTHYTPAPTSFTRPSTYMPSVSSRSYRSASSRRPASYTPSTHYSTRY